jgi:hypothetical protein
LGLAELGRVEQDIFEQESAPLIHPRQASVIDLGPPIAAG